MEPTVQLLLVLLSAVFCSHALSDTVDSFLVRQSVEADPDLENYLREAIENFRDQMREGIDVIGMPVLDPLELQNLEVNVYENMATLDLKIHKLRVQRLSIFNVTKLKPNLEDFFLALNLSLPEIQVDGVYSINGKLAKIFPVYGKGNFEINATEINMFGEGQLAFTTDTLEMNSLKLDFTWGNLAIYMENFLGGGDFSNVLFRILPNLGKRIFHLYKPLIIETLEKSFTDEINAKLNQDLVKEMIKGIIPK